MMPAMAVSVATRLVHLSAVDVVIIAFYFALVLAIGFYLKGRANTGEDFFMAGREMTAWIAGLSFLSANLGSLELMGWAAAAYQYGILATHWYWIGAIPAMLFLAIVMMPFYYISRTHSVPGYLKLRFGESSRALSAVSFAFMTVLMSGINMYSMALVMKVVLGWDINFSIWVSSITVAVYVALGGLRSAIFNEVLQFILIWAGALLVPILGLIEVGGWSNLKLQIARNASAEYTHLWSTLGSFNNNPMGIHWTGIVFGLAFVISCGYWTTDFLVVQRVLAAKDLRSAKMAPIIGAAFKMLDPFIVILISVGTAYLVMSFLSIMDYVQALFSFFIAPLYGTVILGMLWKRATGPGGFWGLLAGTLSSIGMWAWVKLDPSALRYVALSPNARDMAENMYRALWSWIVCVVVTVMVSYMTKPKPDVELSGLVYGVTAIPREDEVPLYQRPVFWAAVVGVVFVILNIMFW